MIFKKICAILVQSPNSPTKTDSIFSSLALKFTLLSCILVVWQDYLVILLVQISCHPGFLRVSSGYCGKLPAHSGSSPGAAPGQTAAPPGLYSEFQLPSETKVNTHVHVSSFLDNNTTSCCPSYLLVSLTFKFTQLMEIWSQPPQRARLD